MKTIEFLKKKEEEMIKFLQELVQTRSQNGVDPERNVAEAVVSKLREFGLKPQLIGSKERPSVMCVFGKGRSKKLFLNAHLDTVSAGDPKNWLHPPFSGKIVGNKMYGRGVADSKAGMVIFCYLAYALTQTKTKLNGQLILGFDADEESGNFSGFKHLIKKIGQVDAAMIGYPGIDEIVIASRGFLRLKITAYGKSAHTGSRSQKGVSAILKMNKIISALEELSLTKDSSLQDSHFPKEKTTKGSFFWFGPKITVSQISGGQAINVVPDKCFINVDIRLVPEQTKNQVLEQIKKSLKFGQDCQIDVLQYQEAFETDPEEPIVKLLKRDAEKVLKKKIKLVASGGGSVGNVLGKMGIPTIAGFGVEFGNAHGVDEWINLETILPVAKIYLQTVIDFLS